MQPSTDTNALEQFVSLSIRTLSVDKTLGFDLYQYHDGNYRLFKHRTLQLSVTDISRLKERGCTTLFVPKQQRGNLYRHMRENLAVILRDPQTPVKDKVAMLHETSAKILSQALEAPESEESIRSVAAQCQNHVCLALLGDESRDTLRAAAPQDQPFHLAHAMSVSNLSILLALHCGVSDPDQLNAIGIGGLLHEVGLVILDRKFYFRKSSSGVQPHSRLRRYPTIGADLLASHPETQGAERPVLEHQERLDGNGYPNRLKGPEISLMGRIVAICDHFDERTNPAAPGRPERPFDTLRAMKNAGAQFDLDLLYAFIRMLGGVDNPAATGSPQATSVTPAQ